MARDQKPPTPDSGAVIRPKRSPLKKRRQAKRAKRVGEQSTVDLFDKHVQAQLLRLQPGGIDIWRTGCTARWSRAQVEVWLDARPRSARSPAFERLHKRRFASKGEDR
jgi:hypothetical protein